MKKILILLIFAVLLLAGCNKGDSNKNLQLKDCGSDKNCFFAKAVNCDLAKAKLKIVPIDSASFSLKYYVESRGKNGENCEFYIKLEKFDIDENFLSTLAKNSNMFQQAELVELYKSCENSTSGKDVECTVPENQIESKDFALNYLENIGSFSTDKYCTGTLKYTVNDCLKSLKDFTEAKASEITKALEEAQQAVKVGNCEMLKDSKLNNSYNNYYFTCLTNKAVLENDSAICETLPNEDITKWKDSCYYNFAKEKKDSTVCGKISANFRYSPQDCEDWVKASSGSIVIVGETPD